MAYVKLDTGILDSTLWVDREARDVFLTALLMALPHEVEEDIEALTVREIKPLGFTVPKGWYGLVSAAGVGILRRAGVDVEAGLAALERLAEPDPESRTGDFDGRRVVRISGGFLVLNFMRYRDRDVTGAERQKRYRERQKGAPSTARSTPVNTVSRDGNGVTNTNVTQAVSSKQEAVSSKQEAGEAVAAGAAATALEVSLAMDAHDRADPAVLAYRHYRAKARSIDALEAQLKMIHNGIHAAGGKSVPWGILGRALHEMHVVDAQLTPATLRAFVKRLVEDPAHRTKDYTPLENGSF